MNILKLLSFISIVSFINLSLLFCGDKPPAAPPSGIITFAKGTVSVNAANAEVGKKIIKGDSVKTGTNSSATIQFSSGAIIILRQNAEISVQNLDRTDMSQNKIELEQTSGSTFSKIAKGKAEYKISSPTAVASVRGTSFSTTVQENGTTEISLLKGKLEVENPGADTDGKKSTELTTGQKITSTSSEISEVKPLSEEETKEMEKMNEIAFIEEETLQREDAEEKLKQNLDHVPEIIREDKANKEDVQNDATKDIPANSKPQKTNKVTLEQLRSQYGTLTKIETKDGKTYIGGDWQQQGEFHSIITVNGKQSIKSSNVAKILPAE